VGEPSPSLETSSRLTTWIRLRPPVLHAMSPVRHHSGIRVNSEKISEHKRMFAKYRRQSFRNGGVGLPCYTINNSLDDCLCCLFRAKKLTLVMNTDDAIAGYLERQEILLPSHAGDANRVGAVRVMEDETG
jgi:hypothetical protein